MHHPTTTKLVTLTFATIGITAFSGERVLAVPPTTSKPAASATNSKSVAASKAAAASRSAESKTPSKSSPVLKPAENATLPNLSGTWNIKFREAPSTKTHIMAVKVAQNNGVLTANGVDEYGDVILNGTFTAPNKIVFKRTYKGAQVNPAAQYEGIFTPATALTPESAKGKWSAPPFADKSLKPKASANAGDWDAHIFTGPAINK